MSYISEFFEGRSVFITGATGFLGKVVLEKLLFSCPGIKTIYVLIRNKEIKHRNHGTNLRFEQLLQSKAFDRIRETDPSLLSKVVPICGDIAQTKLGISSEDEQTLIETTSIVVHSAATLSFNEPLKTAIFVNVIGTKRVFELFKKFLNKDAFIHVSTAFSNCHLTNIDEKVYPQLVCPDFLIDAHEHLNEACFDKLFEALSEGRPNTYTLTKAIAESYLQQNAGGLPVAIVRPPIIGPAFEEPSLGWMDGGSLFATSIRSVILGLLHSVPVNDGVVFNCLPVDFISRIIIAVIWWTSMNKEYNFKELRVYNCVPENGIYFSQFITMGLDFYIADPSTFSLSYPHVSFTKNPFLLKFGMYFNHYLSALSLDILRMAKVKGPKYFNLYRKFISQFSLLTYFIQKELAFETRNVNSLFTALSPKDKEVFNFNTQSISWPDHVERLIIGMKKIMFRDEKINKEEALKKLHMLYWRRIFFNAFLAVMAVVPCVVFIYRSTVSVN